MSGAVILGYIMSFAIGAVAVAVLVGLGAGLVSLAMAAVEWMRHRKERGA